MSTINQISDVVIRATTKKIATHSQDVILGHTTHDCYGDAMKLHHIVGGEDGNLMLPFTEKGIASAKRIVAKYGGYFADNFGNLWVE